MEIAAEYSDSTNFCLLFWFFRERNWSIQSTSTIMKPRRDIYTPGDLVKAKFQGKKYPAVVVRVAATREILRKEGALLEGHLMNSSLSPDEVMKKMDVNCNLPSDKVIEDDSLSLVPQAASTSVTTVQDKDNEVPARAGDGSQKNSRQPVPLLPSLNPTAASDVPVRAGDGSQKNSSQPVPLLPSPNPTAANDVPVRAGDGSQKSSSQPVPLLPSPSPTAASDEHITSPRSRSSRTCRHCRHKCRCDSISSQKKRVERLEKMLHQAPQSSQSSPAAPVPPPSDSHQSALCLVREPSQTQRSNHTSPAECLPFSVETLVDSLKHVAKDNVYGTVKKLAMSVFTEQELCDCSVSGKRSANSTETRSALNAAKYRMLEQAAFYHLGSVTHKAIVEKLQNVQKQLRQKQKLTK